MIKGRNGRNGNLLIKRCYPCVVANRNTTSYKVNYEDKCNSLGKKDTS